MPKKREAYFKFFIKNTMEIALSIGILSYNA
jgi:hypothetical protein